MPRGRRFFNAVVSNLSRWIQSSGLSWRRHRSFRANESPIGPRGENIAADYLRRKGLRILERGYASKTGEIDIIALDQQTLVFVEVKTWQRPAEGGPSDAVDHIKQGRLTQTALGYLKQHSLLENRARFDVIQIVIDAVPGRPSNPPEIRHFENAFEATGRFQMFS